MRKGVLLLTAGFVLLSLFSSPAEPVKTTPATMKRQHDPIQVPGTLLRPLHGEGLDNFRLYSSRKGKLAEVPFQVDERLRDGTFIFHLGEKSNAHLANNQLDPQDFLVFRIGDSGDRVPRESWPSPNGVEIELEDPLDGGKSWVYLLSFKEDAPPRLELDTVTLEHWDPWERPELPFVVRGLSYRIKGLVNEIRGKHYKTAINKDFRVPESAGGTDVNLLDGQKMRAYCEILGGRFRVEANETNFIGGIESLTHGYVRGFGRQWLTVAMPLNLRAPRIYSDVFTYDRIIVSPMILNIPFNPEAMITRAGIEFGYDLNENAYGMRFYSPNCLDGVTIDGKMTEREKAIPDDWVPWYLITGPQGSLLFRVDIEEKFMKQTDNRLTYIDDLDQAFPPEDIPGSIGYARTTIEITSVEPGQYAFQIEWYFPPHLYKPGGYDKDLLRQFLNIKDNPVLIHGSGRTAKNESMTPPPLLPRK